MLYMSERCPPSLTTFGGRRRTQVDRVQRESSVAGNVELGDGQRIHFLQSLALVVATLQFLQALGDVQRDVNQHTIHLRLEIMFNI